jgi:four helix bundle suffix protein
MLVVDLSRLQPPRYVIDFPTKRHWKDKSRLEDIDSGLAALVDEVRTRNIRSIAIPPLGCGLGGLADFVGKADAEIAGNAMICAIHQAVYLLKRQIESQGRQFMQEGGFTEKMYRQRQKTRQKQKSEGADKSDESDGSDKSDRSDTSDGRHP